MNGPDGKPLSGARVFITPKYRATDDRGPVRAETGTDGRFEFVAPDMTFTDLDGLPARRTGLLIATAEWLRTRLDGHLGRNTVRIAIALGSGEGGPSRIAARDRRRADPRTLPRCRRSPTCRGSGAARSTDDPSESRPRRSSRPREEARRVRLRGAWAHGSADCTWSQG